MSDKPSIEAIETKVKDLAKAIHDYELEGDPRSPQEAEKFEQLHGLAIQALSAVREIRATRTAQAAAAEGEA